ncbi:hypothetical protein WICPIJ_004063 [Wickerhamomyces pijperi]|uniref:Transmembrane protein n=1 Tax=Wickerhamomyces pijperi TaxID=599730 RepID=A0A9P8Q6N2_WICPI|nr:hypothetical protein WICPIJ_004063 [Wickerhamomyces pijperi]
MLMSRTTPMSSTLSLAKSSKNGMISSCENNHFVDLTNSSHEFVNTRSLDDIDVMQLVINVNRNDEISLSEELEGRMNQCFIQVQNQTLSTLKVLWLWTKQPLRAWVMSLAWLKLGQVKVIIHVLVSVLFFFLVVCIVVLRICFGGVFIDGGSSAVMLMLVLVNGAISSFVNGYISFVSRMLRHAALNFLLQLLALLMLLVTGASDACGLWGEIVGDGGFDTSWLLSDDRSV